VEVKGKRKSRLGSSVVKPLPLFFCAASEAYSYPHQLVNAARRHGTVLPQAKGKASPLQKIWTFTPHTRAVCDGGHLLCQPCEHADQCRHVRMVAGVLPVLRVTSPASLARGSLDALDTRATVAAVVREVQPQCPSQSPRAGWARACSRVGVVKVN
jgi:hypothetical protein